MDSRRKSVNMVHRLKWNWRGKTYHKQILPSSSSSKEFWDSDDLKIDKTFTDDELLMAMEDPTRLDVPSEDDEELVLTVATKAPESVPRKSVSFSTVEVREYPLRIGDNPNVDEGFPLTMGWKHHENVNVLQVDHHQALSEARRLTKGSSSGELEELSVHDRRLRLRSMGYTEAQLRQAERRRKIQEVHEWAYGSNPMKLPVFLSQQEIARRHHYIDKYIQ